MLVATSSVKAAGEASAGAMDTTPNPLRPGGVLLLMVTVCGLAAWYAWLCGSFPVHFSFDMDHTATLDVLAMATGLLPAHINHTGFGMYLVFAVTHGAAALLGVVSFASYEDVAEALNPLWGVAETTAFLRWHSPFFALGTVVALAAALKIAVRPPAWMLTAWLLILGLAPALGFQASLVRTELYAHFYWSLGVLACAAAAVRSDLRSVVAGTAVAGVLAGLALLTKVQALFHIAAMPLFFAFVRARLPVTPLAQLTPSTTTRRVLATASAAAFLALLAGAAWVTVPAGSATFAGPGDYGLNTVGVLVGGAASVLLALAWFTPGVARAAWPLHVFLAGVVGSFLLHLVTLPLVDGTAFTYLLADAKMLFWRRLAMPPLTWSVVATNLAEVWRQDAGGIVVMAAGAVGVLVRGNRGMRAATAGLITLTVLVAAVDVRGLFRDMIWTEVLIQVLALLWLAAAADAWRNARAPRLPDAVVAAMLAVLMGVVAGECGRLRPRLDAHYIHYGWNRLHMARPVYGASHDVYRVIIHRAFDADAAVAARAAAAAPRFAEVQRQLAFVFPNQRPDLLHASLLAPRFRAGPPATGRRVVRVPPELEGGLLVDNARLGAAPFLLDPAHVRVSDEWWSKTRDAAPNEALAVLPRPDLVVHLFAPAPATPPPFTTATGLEVELESGGAVDTPPVKRTYAGFRVDNYAEIPCTAWDADYFFVITPAPAG
ncbi:MAG: hypothetical protein HY904_24920 [Deltaproteobacteria bacterium]|nr:hypothetical protein [Deltaproteobacteria bacterium]